MPLQKCSRDGKSGWRWGKEGKCYIGPGSKKEALKQGMSIEGPDKFAEIASDDEFSEALLYVGNLAEKVRLVLLRKNK